MFENFGVPSMFLAMQPVLSLFATGRTTGTVLECGDSVTHTVPVYEGFAIRHAMGQLKFGGRHITDFLMKLLQERGYMLTSEAEREITRDMKEKLCFAALDFDHEFRKSSAEPSTVEANYELPDGQVLTLGNERFRATEALFKPSLLSLDFDGVQRELVSSINKCNVSLRGSLYGNIVLSGGSALFPNLAARLNRFVLFYSVFFFLLHCLLMKIAISGQPFVFECWIFVPNGHVCMDEWQGGARAVSR